MFVGPGPTTLVVHRLLFNNIIFSTTILILDSFHAFNSLSYHFSHCSYMLRCKLLNKKSLKKMCNTCSLPVYCVAAVCLANVTQFSPLISHITVDFFKDPSILHLKVVIEFSTKFRSFRTTLIVGFAEKKI